MNPQLNILMGLAHCRGLELHFFQSPIKALARERTRLYTDTLRGNSGPKAGGTLDQRSLVQRLRALELTLKPSVSSYSGKLLKGGT